MLCCFMASSRDAGLKHKREIHFCGWFLKDPSFYSPSVILFHSQYPAVSFITVLELMGY